MNQLSDFHRERVQAVLNASPLVPVITINHPDEALPLCQALVDGGIRVLEITLRTRMPGLGRARSPALPSTGRLKPPAPSS